MASVPQASGAAAATGQDPRQRGSGRMLTRRALLVSIVLTFVTVLWVRQVELIKMTCQITESVPPIPALMALSIGSLVIGAAALSARRSAEPASPGPAA